MPAPVVHAARPGRPGPPVWPALGLGTCGLGERGSDPAAERAALRVALELGYRVFDTAEMYGDGGAESVLGEALAAAQREGLPREQLVVVSKVYPHHAHARGIAAACERSLRRLQLDRIDLYLLHWRGEVPLAETVDGFEQLRARGCIAHWGVSNFDVADLDELMRVPGGTACAANQVWYSLSRRGAGFDLLPWQQSRQMPLMAYSPIDQGALTTHAGLRRLAAASGMTPGQLALAWLLAQPGVMPIPKSADPARLRENWAATRLRLEPALRAQLDALFPPPRRKQALALG